MGKNDTKVEKSGIFFLKKKSQNVTCWQKFHINGMFHKNPYKQSGDIVITHVCTDVLTGVIL